VLEKFEGIPQEFIEAVGEQEQRIEELETMYKGAEIEIERLEELNDTIRNDYNEAVKRIKELEQYLNVAYDTIKNMTIALERYKHMWLVCPLCKGSYQFEESE